MSSSIHSPRRLRLDSEHRQLLGAISDPKRAHEPSAAEDVQHRKVLGEVDRVVEEAEESRNDDRHPGGLARDRRCQNQR